MFALSSIRFRLILRKKIAHVLLGIPRATVEICAPDNIDFVYITNEKVASSTIKTTLFDIKLNDYISQGGSDVTNFKEKYEKATNRSIQINMLKNKIIFSAVRNPYSRILSGYLDKSRGHDRTFEKQFGNKKPHNFLEFLNVLKDFDPWFIDTHFRPQSLNLAIDELKYNYIFFYENFNHLELFLKTNRKISLVKSGSHATNASNLIKDHYNDKSINLVQRIFEKDFKHFGYSNDPYVNMSKFENFLTYDEFNEIHWECKDGILNKNTPFEQNSKLKKYLLYNELVRKKYI